MIIPILKSYVQKFKIGDTIILTEDYFRNTFMLTRGHELTITGKDSYGFIMEENEMGMIIKKCSDMKYTHKATLEESKRKHKNWKDEKKFVKFIEERCPKKDYTYEDRDRVDICKAKERSKKTGYCQYYCSPSTNCIQYIPKEKYKDNSFILDYNRKLKLKKLSNKNEQK